MSPTGRPRIVLVAAVARNGVVGREGAMPWHLPEDLRHFRDVTQGHPVVMGRRTWDSLPPRFRPLPGRRNVVVTRQDGWRAEGAEAAPSLHAALTLLQASEQVCVIGGGEIYAQALPLADTLELTEIDRDYAGDTRFPDFDRSDWAEVTRLQGVSAATGAPPFAWVRYDRRAPA